jgi:hypothetical protein
MTAFHAMIDDLYADPDLAWGGVFTPQAGAPIDVRVMKREPDAIVGGQLASGVAYGLALAVRQSQVPTKPKRGDSISGIETKGGAATVYDVEAATADGERLEWILFVTKRAAP